MSAQLSLVRYAQPYPLLLILHSTCNREAVAILKVLEWQL